MNNICLIREDALLIADSLDAYPSYVFWKDIDSRMVEKGLSSLELSRRCLVSHTIVDKWRKGKAVPKGKERLKELGMALGMNTAQLNDFLYKNAYPPLYARNPFDSAARLLLRDDCGKSDIIVIYHEMIKRLGLDRLSPGPSPEFLQNLSAAMSLELSNLKQTQSINQWFAKHANDFAADEKDIILGQTLANFLLLYIRDASVQELYISGDLPVTIRNLLYPILGRRTVAMKNLREKLIAFCLYCNMTEEEIDTVLELARFKKISNAGDAADTAVLMAVRMGHEHYPLYEYENLKFITARLSDADISDSLKEKFAERLILSENLANYYRMHKKSPAEKAFEEYYTSYSDKGLMDYVHDVLEVLIKKQVLQKDELRTLFACISREEEGMSIWN